MQDAFCAMQAAENVVSGFGGLILMMLGVFIVPIIWAMVIGRNRKK